MSTNVHQQPQLCNQEGVKASSRLRQNAGIYSIDSLRNRVGTALISDFNPQRLENTLIELDADFDQVGEPLKRYRLNRPGYWLSLRPRNCGKAKNPEELIIHINSKILSKDKYFEGLTPKNMDIAYSTLMRDFWHIGLGFIPYDVFMAGACTDTDVKADYITKKPVTFKRVKESAVRVEYKRIVEYSFGKRKSDGGLVFGNRGKATLGEPHHKLYLKGQEMINNINTKKDSYFSSGFLNCELEEKSVIRQESTYKDKRMMDSYGLSNILGELVNTSQTDFKRANEEMFLKWIDPSYKMALEMKEKWQKQKNPYGVSRGIELSLRGFVDLGVMERQVAMFYASLPSSTSGRYLKAFRELKAERIIKMTSNKLEEVGVQNKGGFHSSDLGSFCGGILYNF